MDEQYLSLVKEAAAAVRKSSAGTPRIAMILGSGLSSVADDFPGREIPYSVIPGMPVSTVAGHRSFLKIGPQAAVMAGRFHFYEGRSMAEVVFPLFVLKALGVRIVILTNAAGGIAADFNPGDLVLIKDHINLLGTNPLIGRHSPEAGPRFFDMTEAYSGRLRRIAQELVPALLFREALAEGVYAAMTGPSYETPAEIRFLRAIGADLVGMSTVPEAIAARFLGLEVLGLSCVTNKAAGLGTGLLDHAEVVQTGRRVESDLKKLLAGLVERLSHELR